MGRKAISGWEDHTIHNKVNFAGTDDGLAGNGAMGVFNFRHHSSLHTGFQAWLTDSRQPTCDIQAEAQLSA
jgi:hypothetical protein